MATVEPAHIVNHEGHVVGDKVLAICGRKWKVSMLWNDIPEDHPICRNCVEVAVLIMQETAEVQANTLLATMRLQAAVDKVLDANLGGTLLADTIDSTNEYKEKREAKAEKKATLADARALVEAADAKSGKKKKGKKAKQENADDLLGREGDGGEAPTAPTYESQHTTPPGGPKTVDS